MQLISLWVKDFKNLKDFTINFENQENLSIIIGNNGSGKSNILEAISAIFAELYGTVSHIHNYKLQYKINGHFVEIKKNTEEVPFILGNQSSGQVLRLPKIEFKVDTVKRSHEYLINNNLFPTKIVALYSGEDTHLYNDYYKPFTVSYLRKISKSLYSQTNMIYMDKRYWGISLFALILKANEGDKTANEFLKKELNIKNILDVYMEFDTNKMKKVKYNTPLDILLKIINPEKKALLSMSIEFFLPIISKQYEIENLFNILSQGILTGAIKDFSFVYNKDNIQSEQMSEGEKKKMLVKVALDIVGTENSLILMDEPDAHLHVIAKQYLYNLAKEATQFHRCVIIATHSPTLTNCAEDKHIVMLARNREDQCEIISENSKNCISKLTGGLWTAIEQNIFLNSSRPLILFEGMDDVIYIKQAINYFYKEYPLDVDMLYFGGATNAEEFIKNLKQIGIPNNKKVIVLFDKDKGGYDGLRSCLKACRTKETVNLGQIDYNDEHIYKNESFYYLTYPKTPKNSASKEFVLEDYFTVKTKAKYIKQQIKIDPYSIKNYKNLDENIKKNIRNNIKCIPANEMVGFKVLLAKIQEIIDGTNIQNLVEIN